MKFQLDAQVSFFPEGVEVPQYLLDLGFKWDYWQRDSKCLSNVPEVTINDWTDMLALFEATESRRLLIDPASKSIMIMAAPAAT